MSTLKRFFQDTIIYGFATVLPRLMTFLLAPLQIGVLSTVSYSENTTFYVWAAFFNVVLTYGMETSFFRFFSHSSEKEKVFSTSFIALTTTTILFILVVLGFSEFFINLVDLPANYFYILFAILVLDALVVIPFAYLRASNRPIKFATIKLINIVVVVLLNFYFLWFVKKFPEYSPQFILDNYTEADKVQYIFLANLAASAITFLILLPYFFRTNFHFSTKLFSKMWKYGWPVMVAGIAFVINENLDKLLLKDMLSESIMGAYAGCYKLAVFMTIFVQAFKMGAEPFFFNHSKQENARETYSSILTYFVIFGCLILVVLVSFLDLFKQLIVTNEDYWITISIVPIILLANLFLGIYHNLSVWYKLTDKTTMGMYISIFGAVITIVLNLLLIPVIGFIASAWSTLAAYGSMMVVSYFLGRKFYPVPYNLKKIGIYLTLAILISGCSFIFFREDYLAGAAFVTLFLVIILLSEKKDIQQILKK